ncbi:MAG: LemA family protein [Nitrospirota bacterium]|nr:LemA family protein [Nitrospirota bacterium]
MKEDSIKKVFAKELFSDDTSYDIVMFKKQRQPLMQKILSLLTIRSTALRIAAVLLVLITITAFIYYYNTFITEVYSLNESKAQIETQLQRRKDLIPNLLSAVFDYMKHEKYIFMHAAEMRVLLGKNGTPQGLPQGMEQVRDMLSRFQAIAENYPDLKASTTYQSLMKELAATEDGIAAARQRYNQEANWYNTRISLFPGNIFGHILGFRHVSTFEADKGAAVIPSLKHQLEQE